MASFEKVPWDVRITETKGKAAFSLQNYKEGECIYKERPLVWVPFHWPFTAEQCEDVDRRISELSEADQQTFFDSANAYEDCSEPPTVAAGIFYTNSFDMFQASHGESCAMYCQIARLNHSCRPSTRQQYCDETMCLELIADRDILQGEELTDSYTDITQPVSVRRKALLEFYRFHCDCQMCEEEEQQQNGYPMYPNEIPSKKTHHAEDVDSTTPSKKETLQRKKDALRQQKQREKTAFLKAKEAASMRKKQNKQMKKKGK